MPSTSAPSDAPSDADATVVGHYDGRSAVRRRPTLVDGGDRFELIEGDRRDGPFAFADLIGLGQHDGHAQYGLKGRAGWRIDVALPLPFGLAERLPRETRYGGWIDRIGLWQGAAACAAVAALVVVGLAQMPSVAARLLPREVERRIGAAMVGDFGNRTCKASAGRAALDRLVVRLGPDARIADIRIVNVGIVNAVTLPGGHVLVFDGLLQKSGSADEVAGVIAHELGHVDHRDVVASLIRQLGLSAVLGGLGGDVGGWVNSLLAAGYSREAEGAADGYAIDMLANAGISADGAAAFFGRLAKAEGVVKRAHRIAVYMSSHPMSEDRRRHFAARAATQTATTPALTPAEWRDLRAICRDDPNVARSEMRF